MVSKSSKAPQCANTNRASIEHNHTGNIYMNSISTSEFKFQDIILNPVTNQSGIWFTSSDLAKALGYKSTKSITNLFNQNEDEFSTGMTQVIESVTSGNYRKKVRVFSLRGAHLIAMFSRTPVAKEFRQWVLDILDKEVEQGGVSPMSYQLLCRVEHGKQVEIKMFSKDSTVEDIEVWMSRMRHLGARFLFSEEQKTDFVREQLSKFLN